MFRNGAVLIVEDGHDQAVSLQTLLQVEGIPSEIAGTLVAALTRLQSGGVVCVLLDLTLPDAAGIVAVSKLQQNYPPVPIVVFTGNADFEREALEAGAQEVIIKPGDDGQIVRSVKRAIIRHRVRAKFEPYVAALDSAVAKVDKALDKMHAAEGKARTIPGGT